MEWLGIVSGWLNLAVFIAFVLWVYRRKLRGGLQREMGARSQEIFELQLSSSGLEDIVRATVIDAKFQAQQGELLLGKIQFWHKAFEGARQADQVAFNQIQQRIEDLNLIKRQNLITGQQQRVLATLVLRQLQQQLQLQHTNSTFAASYLDKVCLDFKEGVK